MVIIETGTNELYLSLTDTSITTLANVQLKVTSEATQNTVTFSALSTPTWNTRTLYFTFKINEAPYDTANGSIQLEGPDFPAGFYVLEILEGATILGTSYCLLERTAADSSFRTFTPYNDGRTYDAYEV